MLTFSIFVYIMIAVFLYIFLEKARSSLGLKGLFSYWSPYNNTASHQVYHEAYTIQCILWPITIIIICLLYVINKLVDKLLETLHDKNKL